MAQIQESVLEKLQALTPGQKIQLAMKAQKELRTLLIRDPDRNVQLAVLDNPGITESEVILIAHSRNVDEEVLQRIAGTRRHIRLYQVRLALVQNPKTSFAIAGKLIATLRTQDLKLIAKSKAVPGAVAHAAKRHLSKKD